MARWQVLNPAEIVGNDAYRGKAIEERHTEVDGNVFVHVQFGVPDLTVCRCCQTFTFKGAEDSKLSTFIMTQNFATRGEAEGAASRMWRQFSGDELEFVVNSSGGRQTMFRREDGSRVIGEHAYVGELLMLKQEESKVYSVRLALSELQGD
jgi:hypothetical protein